MPEWFTPLLRVLVAIPSLGNFSTRNTSCQRFDTALAMAHPMTPPPIIKMLAWSMKSEYRKYKEEKRKLLAQKFGFPIILVVYSSVASRKYLEIVSAACFLSVTSVLSANSVLSIFLCHRDYWSPPTASKNGVHGASRDSLPSCTA